MVTSAEATVETARLNLGFTKVRSLISGVAGQAVTQVGNLVSPQTVLTSVSQLNPIKVFFSISDAEYLALVQRARAGGGDLLKGAANLPLRLTLSNGEVYPESGTDRLRGSAGECADGGDPDCGGVFRMRGMFCGRGSLGG